MVSTVYVLKCENDKYFVGNTNEPIKQIYKKHLDGLVCEWTRLYKPLKLISVISPAKDHDEDRYTEMYMNKYGIDNVRGGKYKYTTLDDRMIQYINNEILDEQTYPEINNHNELDLTWDLMEDYPCTDFTQKDIRKIKKYNNKKTFLHFIKNAFYG